MDRLASVSPGRTTCGTRNTRSMLSDPTLRTVGFMPPASRLPARRRQHPDAGTDVIGQPVQIIIELDEKGPEAGRRRVRHGGYRGVVDDRRPLGPGRLTEISCRGVRRPD